MTLPSACGGFAFEGQPPAALPVSRFGRGLSFRYVVTPQVWSIVGEVAVGFDGRDTDPLQAELAIRPEEVAYSRRTGAGPQRFSVTQPVADDAGLEYVRLGSVWAPLGGMNRLYQCVLGSPTTESDLAASPSGAYRRGVLLATAQVREGGATRPYSLDRSAVSISADLAARRVSVSLALVGTPVNGGPDIALGTYTASAPIDPATGDFSADLAGGGVAGALSGRFFGPAAVEIGAALSATVPGTANAPAFSFAGGVYGVR